MAHDSCLPTICGNSLSLHSYYRIFGSFAKNYIFTWNNGGIEKIKEYYGGTKIFGISGGRKEIEDELFSVVKEENIDVIVSHKYRKEGHYSVIDGVDNVKKIIVDHTYSEDISYNHDVFDLIICYKKTDIPKYLYDGVPRDKLFFSPPALDGDVFRVIEGIKRKRRSILFVGRIIRGKRIHLILPFLKSLGATLTIVGPKIDKEYIREMKVTIENLDISDIVEIKGPMVFHRLAEEYNRHEVFIQMSDFDCYSLVLKEALACGLTPVALKNGDAYSWMGGRGYIENDINSFLVRVKSILDAKTLKESNDDFIRGHSLKELRGPLIERIMDLDGVGGFKWREI